MSKTKVKKSEARASIKRLKANSKFLEIAKRVMKRHENALKRLADDPNDFSSKKLKK